MTQRAQHGPVLALTPFDAAEAGEDRLLVRGLLAELAAGFGRFEGLSVVPWQDNGPPGDGATPATYLVRGRLHRRDGRLAVQVALADAPTGVQLWGEYFEVPEGDAAGVRDRIVAKIAFALALRPAAPPARREPPAAPPAADARTERGADGEAGPEQEIRFCTAPDGVRIAYAISGSGPPVVKAANWMSHLEYEWRSPVWRHWMEGLSAGNTLIRYDERCNGLSDREAEDISFEAMVADLESVVDAAALDRFTLLGISQGCAISVAYAVRHPERVTGMIFYGGYVKGWRSRGDPREIARREALSTLIREGWGQDSDAFRQVFTSLFVPGGSREQMQWFNDLQRNTVRPEAAERLHEAFGAMDVSHLLPRVTTPTLVLHARGDRACPFEAGRAFAAGISGARLVTLDSANHILLEHEPAFTEFMTQARAFIDATRPAEAAPAPARAKASPAAPGALEAAPAFLHQGDAWLVAFEGARTVLPDMKGLPDIQRLLASPGDEVHCLDLAGRGGEDDAGDAVLDATARSAYQSRIRDLQEAIEEAEDAHDLARAERAREEMDALIDMLSRTLGLGGRKRTLGNLTERARTTVTWRVRHAIRKIEAAHPALGRHLANSVRTGTFCCYRPEKPVSWRTN